MKSLTFKGIAALLRLRAASNDVGLRVVGSGALGRKTALFFTPSELK
jgi:hypothetical protein